MIITWPDFWPKDRDHDKFVDMSVLLSPAAKLQGFNQRFRSETARLRAALPSVVARSRALRVSIILGQRPGPVYIQHWVSRVDPNYTHDFEMRDQHWIVAIDCAPSRAPDFKEWQAAVAYAEEQLDEIERARGLH